MEQCGEVNMDHFAQLRARHSSLYSLFASAITIFVSTLSPPMDHSRFFRCASIQARFSFFFFAPTLPTSSLGWLAPPLQTPTNSSQIRLKSPSSHHLGFNRLIHGSSACTHATLDINDEDPHSDRTARES